MLDPLFFRIISLGFAMLFLLAAAHKLGDRAHFRASFEAYEIIPAGLSSLVARIIPVLELFLGIGWLILGLFALELRIVSIVSAALLASYALAIAINLQRGRNYIDCGCSFSTNDSANTENRSQQISSGLLIRNLVLVAAALVSTLPISERSLQGMDIFGLVFAICALTLLYGSLNQLLVNRNVINSWRHTNA